MLGAIFGDVVGSVYEHHNIKSKEFPLFSPLSDVTDDSVLTCAVASAFLEYLAAPKLTDLRQVMIRNLKSFGNSHRYLPYGGRFRQWMEDPAANEPYGSFGNGAPMRVSPAGWLFDSLPEVMDMAEISAAVTHDHPQAIAASRAVAGAVFLAGKGADKAQIRSFLAENYCDINFTLDEIRPGYTFDVSCDGTVPFAMAAFLESVSFEDAIRNAVSLGGDSDTLAAITGSVAEAYYGIPADLEAQILEILESSYDLLQTLQEFREFLRRRQ